MSRIGDCNLALLSESALERRGDYESLLYEGRWHRFAELHERATRLAGGLAASGIRPGDRVIVTMANCPEVGIAYNALWRAGAVVTPVTFLLRPEELRHIARDSGARAAITTAELAQRTSEAVNGLDELQTVIVAGDSGGDDGEAGSETGHGEAGSGNGHGGAATRSLAELEAADPAPIAPRADEDLAALLYTGGTTGRAKGVMLTHAGLHYTSSAAQRAAYVAGIHRSLVTLPISHAYGLLVTLSGMHSPERGVAVLMRWFDGEGFLEQVQEHRLQQSALVPTMFQMLLALPLEQYDLSSLRFLSSGGAPLAVEVADRVRRRLPQVSIRQGYGLTETAALVSTNPAGEERPGSVGRPVAGTEVRIADEAGTAMPLGEVGEVLVRSPSVMRGYWNAPEATAEALRDGWLHTGDMGYLDEDGYLFIVDRKKDLIIRGGFNVYPRDVEDALLEHPAIRMAAVVGRPDPHHGEEVVAFVSVDDTHGVDAAAIVDWARERIGGYRYPREVQIVDEVPLTSVGKIDRKTLRAQVSAGSAK